MKNEFLIIAILSLITLQSCSRRSDIVLSAYDEMHYIILYENGREFEILYNGINTAEGTYIFKSDTVILTYFENQFKEFDPNEVLTNKIVIDEEALRVKSTDNKTQFCASIKIDKRKNHCETHTSN